MEQMTITAKIQIVVDETDKVLLDETMSVYRNACNYVSDYVFRTHDLKQFSLNKVLYSTLRENFNLKSQMAQSVLKTVIARYKTILENQNEWMKPSFKKPLRYFYRKGLFVFCPLFSREEEQSIYLINKCIELI